MDYKVTIAILNWNGLHHLQEFLPSVVENSEGAHILLIDNHSNDQSVKWVKETFPEIEVFVHPQNLGFTVGYNLALKNVKTEFGVLLNSDVAVTPNWLSPLLSRLESDTKVAAVQPKILSYRNKNQFEYAGASGGFIDSLGYPFCRGRVFDFCEADLGQYDDPMPIFWASGACMMVRMKAFREAGGFENRFFAHMEEIDLCWRWLHTGYQIWVEPGSVVYHLGAGTLAKTNPKKTFLNFRNGFSMLFTNTLDASLFWKIPLRLALDGLAGIQFLSKGNWKDCLAIVKAHFSFYGSLGYWIEKRNQNLSNPKTQVAVDLILNKSLVFQYFGMKKKTFAEIQEDK